jgi:hypothetical protein
MVDVPFVWPRRMHHVEEARQRFGDLPERLVPYLDRKDPLADAAVASIADQSPPERSKLIEAALASTAEELPSALRELVLAARAVPPWVDWQRLRKAHEVFVRPGILGGVTLGLRSLVFGYAAPMNGSLRTPSP